MYLPYDVEIIIYRYHHEMKMYIILRELKKHMVFLDDCINFFKLYIPTLYMNRFYKYDFFKNHYFLLKIHKFIHYKKMAICHSQLTKINSV